MTANESMSDKRHPDDAAVAEVRAWLDGLDDEAVVQFKVRRLRGVLNVLDGWERNARGAAAQRNAAEGRLGTAKVDMRMLQDDLAATDVRADAAERKLAESLDALTVAAELIDRLTDNSTCDYDHHDNCRTHSLQRRPCPHPLGRQFVEAWRAVEAEQEEAADDA